MKDLEAEMFARMKVRDALKLEKEQLVAARAEGLQYRAKVQPVDTSLVMLAGCTVINKRLSLVFDVLAAEIEDLVDQDLQCAEYAYREAALAFGSTLPECRPLAPPEKD